MSTSGRSSSSVGHMFSQSVNYMVTRVLYDQFRALNEDFSRAVGSGGEFRGSVREFRRRHQRLSESVQNADRFIMISNVAGFCFQIANLIVVLYCTIFFRDETILRSALPAFLYVVWLVMTLFVLTLTAGQGIAVNNVVRVSVLYTNTYLRL